ncbi:SulP family inorganic anion transporter [Pseudanabaena sp. FACHB-1998]|uniref:SulP family inorganic anion transporter n=1 Tax=Pseudanabaena sp. FACHB-1998 TaxID=2692858 RepID=UPI001681721F|nr:SulP family inorganic anion transporter [Pseudanabaena sp. FACHB-1998]MBD2177878.1 SulP family inorganic anion transporter [Pseudanabaena sp. FACHB-1998]
MTKFSPDCPYPLTSCPQGLAKWIPLYSVLTTYKLTYLIQDISAGIALTAILIPAGMGYASAAGLPPIYGLYATIAPLIAYAIFGPSRILILGPDSALIPLISATILPLSQGDPLKAIAIAGILAIISGFLCIVAGLAKFGFITELISKPIRYGYLNGIAITVLIAQLPKIFGFSVKGQTIWEELWEFFLGVKNGRTNFTALTIGIACLAIILVLKKFAPKVSGVLIAMVGATVISSIFGLSDSAGIDVIGVLPQGLPSLQIPSFNPSEFKILFSSALAIALVSFTDMSLLSRTFAIRGGYRVDRNQELIALGIANIAAGLFQGFSVSSSASRTPVAEAAGAKTQITGLVGTLCIAFVLLFTPMLLQSLPLSALSAVVISAGIAIFEISGTLRLYQLRPFEFLLSIVCFAGVAFLGVIQGIFIAIGLALFAFIWSAWRPHYAVLGRVDGIKGYHDVFRHPEARRIPGLVIFRWDAPLFFANAEIFCERVMQAIATAPTITKWVLVAAEPVTDIDLTAADAIAELDRTLCQLGIEICFAEMKGPTKDRLKRYGLFSKFGIESFFPTIGQAVDVYLESNQVEWHDWDE